ncbi:DUF3995 domain-containing protein [Cohnella terricola]|uniref:DUF3995 domain-containing protein n=1 Tax=Cohnella terricola TaxID=1289167 RepID=A0A559J8Y4_9BACL|nr:DUF3995 domain-containing protein [Cohnella terricola]TVX96311.1 DUF3995 domain-containing protein [Cohnella terricola]
MNNLRHSWPIIAGMIWSFVFALMSFYWACGGMIGAATLGGEIYQMALSRQPDFIKILWLTGVVKVVGGVLLWMMLSDWKHDFIRKSIYYAAFTSGILLFVYGLANFATIFLSIINVLELKIESEARWWRLLFWEPYWMLGGILFFISSKRFAHNL